MNCSSPGAAGGSDKKLRSSRTVSSRFKQQHIRAARPHRDSILTSSSTAGAEKKTRLSQSAFQRHEETTLPAQRPDMASWGNAKLFFCILFITCCCYCTVTFAQIPIDCCLSVRNKTIERQVVVGYSRQHGGQGCSIDAMIFVSRRGKKLCVPHDEPWVQGLVKHVDSVGRYCKKHNYQGIRCTGVPRM